MRVGLRRLFTEKQENSFSTAKLLNKTTFPFNGYRYQDFLRFSAGGGNRTSRSHDSTMERPLLYIPDGGCTCCRKLVHRTEKGLEGSPHRYK